MFNYKFLERMSDIEVVYTVYTVV